MNVSNRALDVLRITMSVGETSAPYNQFSLPLRERQNITICTYHRATVAPEPEITLFEGNSTILGFWRILQDALRQREYDIIHVHSPVVGMILSLLNLLQGKRLLSKTVCTVHNSYLNFPLYNRLLFLPAFAFYRQIICCGQASLESFPALYKWLAGDRLVAVPNGMDIDRVDSVLATLPPRPPQESFDIITIGRLIPIKNPLTALRAFQQSAEPNSHLIYLGEGNLRQEIEQENRAAASQGKVTLAGLVAREEVFAMLNSASLFISTSYGEGLPVAVLEAMACGLPVILSDIPPHQEIAKGCDFIPLIDPDDMAGFAEAIQQMQALTLAERQEIGAKCRKIVETRFSLPAMHRSYIEIYESIANGGGGQMKQPQAA